MKFLRKFSASFHTRAGAFVFYALAAGAFILWHSARWAYGWIADLYPAGFIPLIFWLIGICAAATLAFLLLPKKLKERRALRVAHTIICVLAGAMFGYVFVLQFGLDSGPSMHAFRNGWVNLVPNLGYLGLALGLPFAFVIFPKLKKPAKVICAAAISLTVAATVLVPYAPVLQAPFGMQTLPLVLDIGDDNYSVVFVTNRRSTAYVRYTFEGEEFTVASAEDGRLRTGRIHSVIVPREHLNGNAYRIIAREVLLSIDSGVEFGTMIESDVFHFRGEFDDEVNILLGADIHNQGDKMIAAAANMPPADLFIMLGDMSSAVNSEDRLINYIIDFGAQVTRGEILAMFARGNHEMYGDYTHIIRPGLGMPSFYFQSRRGNLLFTIADGADWSGERLDFTEHVRGSANSENDLFREEQLAWLESLEPGDETLHFVAIHRPAFGNNEQRELFFGQLARFGVDMQLSADEHRLRLELPGEEGRYDAPHPLLIAGGPTDGYGGLMICTMVQVRADGSVRLLAYDSAGEQRMDETIRLGINEEDRYEQN